MGIPQVIALSLIIAGIVLFANRHGQPKEGKYSLSDHIISSAIWIIILYCGGFFD